MITQQQVREYLDYDPTTGILIWLKDLGRNKKGTRAGSQGKPGTYRGLFFNGVSYQEHRIIWLWYHGKLPETYVEYIDHINRIKDDNRIENLRCVSQSVNLHNHDHAGRSGVRGVSLQGSRWWAQINMNGKLVYSEYFDTKEEAVKARQEKFDSIHAYHFDL